MTKKSIIIVSAGALIVAGLAVFGYLQRPKIAYYFYEKKVRHNSNFTAQKDALKKNFMQVYKNPKDAENYLNLGATQYALEDFGSAIENFQKSLKYAPLNIPAASNLVRTYEKTKDYDKAENLAKDLIARYPQLPDSYVLLIELYQFYKVDKQAHLPQIYSEAFEKTKNWQFILLAAGYFEKEGDWQKATEFLNQWLESPENAKDANRIIVENLLKSYKEKLNK